MKTINICETYDEKLTRVASHIKATNRLYTPKPIQYYIKQDYHPTDHNMIMDRIKTATKTSPIIVVRCRHGLTCFFANTVAGWYLQVFSDNFVGKFDNTMNLDSVECILRKEMRAYQ